VQRSIQCCHYILSSCCSKQLQGTNILIFAICTGQHSMCNNTAVHNFHLQGMQSTQPSSFNIYSDILHAILRKIPQDTYSFCEWACQKQSPHGNFIICIKLASTGDMTESCCRGYAKHINKHDSMLLKYEQHQKTTYALLDGSNGQTEYIMSIKWMLDMRVSVIKSTISGIWCHEYHRNSL
jgi:hypothetical protein